MEPEIKQSTAPPPSVILELEADPNPKELPNQSKLGQVATDMLGQESRDQHQWILPAYRNATGHFHLGLTILNDAQMALFNQQYRGKLGPTDVLSFPSEDFGPDLPSQGQVLGDILISWDTLLKQAEQFQVTAQQEFWRLFIHGFLHLLGYDHERGPEDERIMEEREQLYRQYV